MLLSGWTIQVRPRLRETHCYTTGHPPLSPWLSTGVQRAKGITAAHSFKGKPASCKWVCISSKRISLSLSLSFYFYLFIYFWPCRMACVILVPQTGSKAGPPLWEVWRLNHWTAREAPPSLLNAVGGSDALWRCTWYNCPGPEHAYSTSPHKRNNFSQPFWMSGEPFKNCEQW